MSITDLWRSDLWTIASSDLLADEHAHRLTAARIAAADVISALARCDDRRDFENRRSLYTQRLDAICQRVANNDPTGIAILRADLEASLVADYDVLQSARQAEQQRQNAPRAAARHQGTPVPLDNAEKCPTCHGKGWTDWPAGVDMGNMSMPRCKDCGGTGIKKGGSLQVEASPKCKTCGAPTGAPQMPKDGEPSGADAGPIYKCRNGHRHRYPFQSKGATNLLTIGDSVVEGYGHESSLQKGAPFAGYKDFDACVAANSDKGDPEAYCGKIKHQVEGAADWVTVTVDAGSLDEAVSKVKAEYDDVGTIGQQRKVGDGKVEVKYLPKTAGVVIDDSWTEDDKALLLLGMAEFDKLSGKTWCKECGKRVEWDPDHDEKVHGKKEYGRVRGVDDAPGRKFPVMVSSLQVQAEGDPRSLAEIAREVRSDWKNVYFGAVPYLDAMSTMNSIKDPYGADSGDSIIAYFLSNAQTWRGETAKRVKAELKAMLGRYASFKEASGDPNKQCSHVENGKQCVYGEGHSTEFPHRHEDPVSKKGSSLRQAVSITVRTEADPNTVGGYVSDLPGFKSVTRHGPHVTAEFDQSPSAKAALDRLRGRYRVVDINARHEGSWCGEYQCDDAVVAQLRDRTGALHGSCASHLVVSQRRVDAGDLEWATKTAGGKPPWLDKDKKKDGAPPAGGPPDPENDPAAPPPPDGAPAEGDAADAVDDGSALDPSTMQAGQAVTVDYTLTGSAAGNGQTEATFESFDGTQAFFTYEGGRFAVTQQGGKWVDAAGTEFDFALSGQPTPVQPDPNQPPEQTPPAAPAQQAPPAANPPPSNNPFEKKKSTLDEWFQGLTADAKLTAIEAVVAYNPNDNPFTPKPEQNPYVPDASGMSNITPTATPPPAPDTDPSGRPKTTKPRQVPKTQQPAAPGVTQGFM